MRLYVGNLPYHTTEQDLLALFEQIGEVQDVSIITDRETGRSKGFGFVEMGADQAAHTAIAQLNGTFQGNRTITVNEARERQMAGNRSFQGSEQRTASRYRSPRF